MAERAFADGRLRLRPGRVAEIVLAAPERRNAIGRAMWAALPALCAAVAADAGIRAVVLRAEPGPDGPVFSAGADISEFAEVCATPESAAAYNALVRAGQQAVADLPRPVIAAVAGPCVGGGCGLALSADLRFAAQGARFGITPARLGLAYSVEDTARLVAAVGPSRAKDLLFSGRLLDAGEALHIGLVDRVVAPEALAVAVGDYAEALAELAPGSIRAAKATVDAVAAGDAAAVAAARALIAAAFGSAEFAEGRQAFAERRRPKF
jgi:enoyl-CoA hydratase/carnithine racemase